MIPSPKNGERTPRPKGEGFSFVDVVLLLLSLAIVAGMVLHSPRAKSAETPTMRTIITANTWLTTEDGRPVCRTTTYIMRGMQSPSQGFCADWQPPFQPMVKGQQWPTGDGWVRVTGNRLQFHTEQGWLP